jgi:hypothetical protein
MDTEMGDGDDSCVAKIAPAFMFAKFMQRQVEGGFCLHWILKLILQETLGIYFQFNFS